MSDPHSLSLKTFVNGKQMQNGNTKTFIFDVSYLVSYLSNLMTLMPGDLIATGTPPGVGLGMKPPVYLNAGRRRAHGDHRAGDARESGQGRVALGWE